MHHLVLIGAGPHGLAVLVALAAAGTWPQRVTVVDPQPGWCAAWDGKLARLDLDRLRSPQVHHPGTRPMALRDMVEALPDEARLALRRPEAERVPTPAGMRRLIDDLTATLGPVEHVLGTATAITPTRPPGLRPALQPGPDHPGDAERAPVEVTVANANGEPLRQLEADAVVVAHNPSFPRIPDWAAPLVADGRAEHAATVDLRTVEVGGDPVVIVGGGLTAACLALGAAHRGARVLMLSRRPLRARPYDVDASWLGPRRLADYHRASISRRRDLIDIARDGGTIPPRTLALLRDAVAAGRIELREGVDTEREACEEISGSVSTHLWLATGFEQDLARDRLVGPLVDELGIRVERGLPDVGDDLRLGGTQVFVTGPYAALTVGPACRNLAGARPAAQRIAAALTRSSETLPASA
ncbi:MAG: SidA/IucD/PvdA family monooxygenase [Solirubrobacteraceae bacterium]|nr:SidA/IucD/PvdA family monooxygenase [Solirubrobacteraceae bacterium]